MGFVRSRKQQTISMHFYARNLVCNMLGTNIYAIPYKSARLFGQSQFILKNIKQIIKRKK
jgi:hypothetical protein